MFICFTFFCMAVCVRAQDELGNAHNWKIPFGTSNARTNYMNIWAFMHTVVTCRLLDHLAAAFVVANASQCQSTLTVLLSALQQSVLAVVCRTLPVLFFICSLFSLKTNQRIAATATPIRRAIFQPAIAIVAIRIFCAGRSLIAFYDRSGRPICSRFSAHCYAL